MQTIPLQEERERWMLIKQKHIEILKGQFAENVPISTTLKDLKVALKSLLMVQGSRRFKD